ncbi:MAG: DNA polymerase III subunit delta [Clostridiaceae bacterium]|nr:DNA polymerase III subunit delta [Clostridiaceae bacterium]
MAVKKQENGAEKLKKDLQSGVPGKLYLIYGEEDYLKKYYLDALKTALVDETFAEFNLVMLEGKGLTPESLSEAVESYPAFAERKLVIVSDFDLYKPPAAFQNILLDLLGDLPDYICLVFYYDTLTLKPDKRTKMHGLLDKTACFADFSHLQERELISWIRRRVRALGKDIDQDTCAYMIFLCGTSMTNLITEIEKVAAHCTLDEIKRYNIDSVCTRVLDAVIFDLTDAITAHRFERAIEIVGDLLAQKNSEVAIFSAILRHIQRLYAAKLNTQSRGNSKELLALIGSNSSFYAKKLTDAARGVSLEWLRNAVRICGETDAALKSSVADKQKIIELALLQMASDFEGIS